MFDIHFSYSLSQNVSPVIVADERVQEEFNVLEKTNQSSWMENENDVPVSCIAKRRDS